MAKDNVRPVVDHVMGELVYVSPILTVEGLGLTGYMLVLFAFCAGMKRDDDYIGNGIQEGHNSSCFHRIMNIQCSCIW